MLPGTANDATFGGVAKEQEQLTALAQARKDRFQYGKKTK